MGAKQICDEGILMSNSIQPIRWLSMRDLCESLGMCVNTFKRHYLERFPPQRVLGTKKYWSEARLVEIQQSIQQG